MNQFPNLQQFDRIAIDSETDGLKYFVNKAFGFSISTPDGKDYYYDVRETPKSINWINDQLRTYTGKKIFHFFPYQWIRIFRAGSGK